MRKIAHLFSILLIFGLIFTLTSCSLSSILSDVNSTVNSLIVELEGFDSNGHFKKDTTYHVNGNMSYEENITYYSLDYIFGSDGKLKIIDLSKKEEDKYYDYVVINNLIKITSNGVDEYLDIYGDVIAIPVELTLNNKRIYLGSVVGTKDGVVVSEKSKSIAGYHIELNVSKDDVPAVLTGSNTSKGMYYKIYQNGVLDTNSKGEYRYYYLNADQVPGFDSSEIGIKLVDVTINKKVYKAVLRVTE